jgi:predicted membrane protein (TIGR00267 family)
VSLLDQVKLLHSISRTSDIVRRYFVVNGFDGALTMLGMIIGFMISATDDLTVIINACLGAAIALGMSGLSSAYVSEVAERKRALSKLEEAMITDLGRTAHGDAARWVPVWIALVNGLAPLLISLLILLPLWLSRAGMVLPLSPLYAAIIVALLLIFMLGVLLGQVAGISWLRSGIQTLLVALVTATLIYLFTGF